MSIQLDIYWKALCELCSLDENEPLDAKSTGQLIVTKETLSNFISNLEDPTWRSRNVQFSRLDFVKFDDKKIDKIDKTKIIGLAIELVKTKHNQVDLSEAIEKIKEEIEKLN